MNPPRPFTFRFTSLALIAALAVTLLSACSHKEYCGFTDADGKQACLPYPKENFTPTTEGKKLLCYRGPYVGDDDVHFDGVITGGMMAFQKKYEPDALDSFIEKASAKDHGRHTDNFYLVYSYPGKTGEDYDWYDDLDWVAENWRIAARAAKKSGFVGICFDSEYYEGLPLFGYVRQTHAKSKSYEEYRKQVFKQGAKVMRAVNTEFPDIKIMLLFGYSGSYYGVPQHPVSREQIYTLVSAFVDGMLSECGPEAEIYDMHEQSFSNRVPGSYARQRAMMTELMPEKSFVPDKYRSNHRAGFSFWADCWENASQGRPFSVDDFETNYYTPEEFAYSIHHALAYSDGYVWMWPGVMNWWKGTAKTLDENGEEVMRPLPQEYLDALKIAHQPTVPEPKRDRKPNTYRNLPAKTQEGYKDEATFDDLWEEYTFVEDLPLTWRFKIDPDEVGHKEGWHAEDFDDSEWDTVEIREFWENQGYSPYDGAGWYRLEYTVPDELPEDSDDLYLAFGAVSDEASVFVDGNLQFASRYGDNMRHQRFLVDVSDLAEPGETITLAVRAWNVNWCGGIWKNVKLVAEK